MKPARRIVPPEVLQLLDKARVEWSLVNGRKHWQLVVAGSVVAVLSHGTGSGGLHGRKNVVSAVRRRLEGTTS